MIDSVVEIKETECEFSEISLLSKTSVARLMKIGKDRLAELINNGFIGVVMDNNKELIPYFEIKRYIKDNLIYRKSVCDKQIKLKKKNYTDQKTMQSEITTKSSDDLFNEIILEN